MPENQSSDSTENGAEATREPIVQPKPERLLEWLKTIVSSAGLLGIAVTAWIGAKQIQLTREAQVAERFDRALSRMSSDKINERLMGISSLKLFLRPGDDQKRADALYFLINSVTFEQDSRVQLAILDPFKSLSTLRLAQTVLNGGLDLAVERDRALTRSLVELNAGRKQTGPNAIEHTAFAKLTKDELRPLSGMWQIFAAFIPAGAKTNDLSSISCVGCFLCGLRFFSCHARACRFREFISCGCKLLFCRSSSVEIPRN